MLHYFLSQVTASTGGTINEITSQSFDPQTNEIVASFDGQVDATYAAVMSVRPMANFSSLSIAAALTAVPIGGLAFSSTPFDMHFQPAADGGTRDAANCVKMSMAKGFVVLNSITADEGGLATADLSVHGVSADGTTSPLTVTTGATLPTASTTRVGYVLGPAKLNNTTIPGVKSVSINFGLGITVDEESGQAYPVYGYIAGRRARATIRTTNLELASTLGMFVGVGSTTKLYLRKVAQNGTRVADATAQHISFTISAGMILIRRVGGAGTDQPQMLEIEVPITFDGTNGVLGISTATAIT